MPSLNKNTPKMTKAIDYFIAKFKDGSVKKIKAESEGFYREGTFIGSEKSFRTYECFVAEEIPKEV